MADNVIELPEQMFILRCHECGCNAFYIHLGSRNPDDRIGYQCIECEDYWDIKETEIQFIGES